MALSVVPTQQMTSVVLKCGDVGEVFVTRAYISQSQLIESISENRRV